MSGPEVIRVTRQGLYEHVWSVPVSRACKTYGLSDVGLARICDRWGIPCPPRGYWAKVRHGHRVRRPTLKPIPEGDPVVLSYGPSAARTDQKADRHPTAADRQRAFERQPENQIAVAARLTDPHPRVARTGTSIRSAKPDPAGGSPRP